MTAKVLLRTTVCFVSLVLVACTGDGKKEEGTTSTEDILGYYTYADPTRGGFSLALLEDNRFMLVTEPGSGVPQGVTGWYVLREDEIHLSSKRLDAYGTVDGEIVRLTFGEPGIADQAQPPDTTSGLPFVREDEPAQPENGTGSSSGSGSGSQKKSSSSGGSSGKSTE